MKDKHQEIQDFLKKLPDDFDILEVGIDMKVQKEYLDYSHSFDHGDLTEEETLHLSRLLFDTNVSLDGKKKALALLAHLGTILAYRQIEKYYKNSDKKLKQWTALALQECKMFLQSTLTEESIGFISSGLGGLENRLRYYFMVLPLTEKPFTDKQKDIISDEFKLVCKDLNSVLESTDLSGRFVGLTILMPMDVAVGTVAETGIEKCNELGDFVFEYYYATNQDIPDENEIEEIIKKVRYE